MHEMLKGSRKKVKKKKEKHPRDPSIGFLFK